MLRHRIDFDRIQPIIELLEYLNTKLSVGAAERTAVPAK